MNIEFPHTPSEGPPKLVHFPAPQPSSSTPLCRNILVVDDDASIRVVTQRLLENAGYLVRCAEDGQAGRLLLCEESFDVLVTDHLMPRLSGVELLRWLRSVSNYMPVVLISGSIPWEEPGLIELLIPGDALEKPFSCAQLLTKVRTVWNMTVQLGEGIEAPWQAPAQALVRAEPLG